MFNLEKKTAGNLRCPPCDPRSSSLDLRSAVVTEFAVFGFVETGHFDFFRRTQTHEQFGNVGVLFTNNITLTNNGGDAGAYFIYKYVAMTLFWATSYFDGWSAGFSPLQRLFARQR